MQTISGYICVARFNDQWEMLFGQPTDLKFRAQKHESLLTNGLNPYPTLREAQEAKQEILKRRVDASEVWVGRIEINMAESYEENEAPLFRESDSLVIIVKNEYAGHRLLGPAVDDRPLTCNETCADFVMSGLKPFGSYQAVRWPLRQAARLTQLPTRLATFSLERVD